MKADVYDRDDEARFAEFCDGWGSHVEREPRALDLTPAHCERAYLRWASNGSRGDPFDAGLLAAETMTARRQPEVEAHD